MRQLTVNALKKLVDAKIKKGNGNKIIIISDDAEGNGFHGLWGGFTDGDDVKQYFALCGWPEDSETDDPDKIIILG